METATVAIFARAPVPGRVKTRLLPVVTPEAAASLHDAFVRDLLGRCRSLPGVTCELHTDTCTDVWRDTAVTRKLQIAGDLGLKMFHAANAALAAGTGSFLIVGADAPTVSPESLTKLLLLDADVALGPAEDGGYYAIAFRRTHSAMFDGVSWGSDKALEETVRACRSCGLTVALGPVWYDVDRPEDLDRLRADPELGEHTRAVLAAIGKS